MPRRRATVGTATGLHARPAALFTRRAAESGHAIQVGREGQPLVDATSILMVMGLRLEHGDQVVLSADHDDAESALDDLAGLLETDLDAAPVAER